MVTYLDIKAEKLTKKSSTYYTFETYFQKISINWRLKKHSIFGGFPIWLEIFSLYIPIWFIAPKSNVWFVRTNQKYVLLKPLHNLIDSGLFFLANKHISIELLQTVFFSIWQIQVHHIEMLHLEVIDWIFYSTSADFLLVLYTNDFDAHFFN